MTIHDRIMILTTIVGGVGSLLVSLFCFVLSYFRRMVISIEQLNVSLAVVVEKINSHERRLDRLEGRNPNA